MEELTVGGLVRKLGESDYLVLKTGVDQVSVLTGLRILCLSEFMKRSIGQPSESGGVLFLASYDGFAGNHSDPGLAFTYSGIETFGIHEIEPVTSQWHLTPTWKDEEYLRVAQKCIDDICRGRFYQINLLRYFQVHGDFSAREILVRLMANGGPYGAWLKAGPLDLISLSPERFCSWQNGMLTTWPIKGTTGRGANTRDDQILGEELKQSEKDSAELAMIVDLMRHDLSGICAQGSVKVEEHKNLVRFPSVQHLQSRISGQMDAATTWGKFLQGMCPAGSITGAPKVEVMAAIRDYERRNRTWFMGNLFVQWPDGSVDSSVLIRTLIRTETEMEYAAGSGLVASSDPEKEMKEIETKTLVLNPTMHDTGSTRPGRKDDHGRWRSHAVT